CTLEYNIAVKNLKGEMFFSKELNDECNKLNESNYLLVFSKMEKIISEKIIVLHKNIESMKCFNGITLDEIELEILENENDKKDYEDKLINANADSIDKRIEKSLVVAATVDACLGRLLPDKDIIFCHVFLDEAGYCSLIKAVTLTAYKCPITFLGDHMQLSPVCEADDQVIESNGNSRLSLWAQSALFVESVFNMSPDEIYREYISRAKPHYRYMLKYSLYKTHRFGNNLAKVLAGTVYDERFYGVEDMDTSIYYIDAHRVAGDKKRVNIGEIKAIDKLLKQYPELTGCAGIITPYKNQLEKLKKVARENSFPSEDVVTVHGSQGREWEKVIFSVSDTSNKYFTDSNNKASKGKELVNTAISRTKKMLIIVCDYNYWISQEDQLIGKLLSIAKEFMI
ncbi:MAG: hypothetical protein IJF98_07795, partial [Firmicutes bacterium]|nr:hypothetical protein [Bacillota bacterium]